jgi:hypothetical protein
MIIRESSCSQSKSKACETGTLFRTTPIGVNVISGSPVTSCDGR